MTRPRFTLGRLMAATMVFPAAFAAFEAIGAPRSGAVFGALVSSMAPFVLVLAAPTTRDVLAALAGVCSGLLALFAVDWLLGSLLTLLFVPVAPFFGIFIYRRLRHTNPIVPLSEGETSQEAP